MIGGQTFVNNASFGAYAEVVETPAYRGDKLGTTLELLPDLLQGHSGARLAARADGTEITAPQALLVANNPYGTGDIAGLGRRARLDRGVLGVVGVKVGSARAGGRPAPRQRTPPGCSVLTATGDRDHRRRAADPGRHRRRGGMLPAPVRVHRSAPARSASGCRATGRESRGPSPR